MTAERSTRLTLWLAVAALFTPLVWIEIGPQGHAFYGPEVPDIHILGALILGKSWAFLPIFFVMTLQFGMILCFICCAYFASRKAGTGASVRWFVSIQQMLLVLFPFWLMVYVDGVIGNSDHAAADLRVHPHGGLILYVALWILTINTLIRSKYA